MRCICKGKVCGGDGTCAQTTGQRILSLFNADSVVLRPSEIIRRTKRGAYSVRAELKRLVSRGRLFHIAHSQYARIADAKPIEAMRAGHLAALERRVAALEAEIQQLRPTPPTSTRRE